jgi:hypothetical protein
MRALIAFVFCFTSISAFAGSEQFNGDWRCVSSERDVGGMATEAVEEDGILSYVPIGHLQIKNGIMYMFDYPCQYLGYHTLFRSDSAWCFREDEELRQMDMHKDTLVVTSRMMFIGSLTRMYVRDTLDPAVLKSLRAGILNPSCMGGDWYVVREEWCCYGTQMVYQYPYALADTVHLDSVLTGDSYAGKRHVVISVDGKRRRCKVEYSYDSFVNSYSLWLTPVNSPKGRTRILYRRCEED